MQGRQPPERLVLSCISCLMQPQIKRYQILGGIRTGEAWFPRGSHPILQQGSNTVSPASGQVVHTHAGCSPVNN